MKFIVDKEINLNPDNQGTSNDLLHTKQYADILLQSIKDAPQGESYTIGLFGEWGSGKSSVITTMSENVSKDPQLEKFKIVNYDAWKYSGDSFRRMFLYELRNAFGMKESLLMQRFYINEIHETKIKISLNWKKIGIVIAFVVLSAITVWIINSILGKNVAIPSTIALVALLFSLCTFIFDQLKISVNKPLLFAPEQFEDCYKEMVGCSVKWDKFKEKTLKWITFGLHHEQYQRLIIIIDNIDRCQPDKAYTLLTDIKNFLCKEFDVIFIVPVDIYALRKHIVKSSSEQNSIEADEFLRKFFNTSIWMKAYQTDEMYNYASGLARQYSLDYSPDTITIVANEFATNPRRIIQLFNNLQIELSMYPEAFAKEHQALICKLLVIREEFPAYHRLLMANPSMLFMDGAYLRKKEADKQTNQEKAVKVDDRLVAFLNATTGVSSRYEKRVDVVVQILVNTQTGNLLPENIRQAYRTGKTEELQDYAQDAQKRELLTNYLQDNIKKMVSRQTVDAEGKTHIDVLLILFDNNLLTSDDKQRLFEPIESPAILSKIINLYKDRQPLIRLGKDLETLRLPKLTNTLENDIKNKDQIGEVLTAEDARNIFYAASLWTAERCKSIAEKFREALEANPVECRNYNYTKDKFSTLLTDEVYKYIIEKLSADDCEDDKSTFQTFRHLCHIQAVTKERLMQFVEKATEIAPSYDYNNPQETKPRTYLKALSEIFAELRYLGRVAPMTEITKLFDKINHQSSETINVNYSRTETRHHSFLSERASEELAAAVINDFFANVNLVTDGPVVSNAEIERFTEVEDNRDKFLEKLMFLKGQGIDVSTWTNTVIKDSRRTDVKRIEILKDTFRRKDKKGAYEVSDNVVKNEISEMIKLIQTHAEGQDILVEMFKDLLNDERIDRMVREILAGKSLEEQKQLPLSLMQRAISSFEKNIGQLSIDNDINILQLIASQGSSEGLEGVWGIINPLLADGKNIQPKSINNAIHVLLSFSKMTKEQAEALAGNVKALPTNKLPDDKKKEVLQYIIEHS